MSYEAWGDGDDRDYYTEAEMAEVQKEHAALTADLAMMIRRLSRALGKSDPNTKLVEQAASLLAAHGLAGSPLRSEP
jgi:hypothetical protein